MIRSIFVSSILALSLSAAPSRAAEYVVALSPFLPAEAARENLTKLLQFSTQLEPGDRVQFFDGYETTVLGAFVIPEKAAYKSAKARLAVNGALVKTLMTFAKSSRLPAGAREPQNEGAIRLPQLLRAIASSIPGDNSVQVVLVGSALYDDPREPNFTMTGGRYPSDGHLSGNRGETVYGARGSAEILDGIGLHIAFGDRSQFMNEAHNYYVERFWTLYAERLGGTLVSFTPEITSVLQRVQSGARAMPHGNELDGSKKIEMIRLKPPEPRKSIYEREVSTQPLRLEEVQRAGKVEVGLSWDCAECDLDIYAISYPGADPIYFGNPQTREGTLWKDHQSSPRASQGFETIAFHQALDLRALSLAVNFYRGEAPGGVQAEVRIAVGGKTYAHSFHIEASEGNKAAGVKEALETGHSQSAHTHLVDSLMILEMH